MKTLRPIIKNGSEYTNGILPHKYRTFTVGILVGLLTGIGLTVVLILIVSPYRYDYMNLDRYSIPMREHRITGQTEHYLFGWESSEQDTQTPEEAVDLFFREEDWQ